jgi:hypothetical protein
MIIPPVFAVLNGMLVSAAYSALTVVFWGLVYVIGCVLIVVMSPKICKGIFAGSCGLGSLVGNGLTAVTSAALGAAKFGAATGLLGSGNMGQAASTVLDIPLPGGAAAGSGRAPKTSGAESAGGAHQQASRQSSASMEAILATGVPAANHRATGGVSRLLKRRAKTTNPKAPNDKEI